MDSTFNLIFVIFLLLHSQFQSVVASENVLLGFDPEATLLRHCLVGPGMKTPNIFENNSMTIINLNLFVNKIHELEPVSRTFSLTGALALDWRVPCVQRLFHNETLWLKKEISFLNLNPSQFWKPTFTHRSGYTEINLHAETTDLTMELHLEVGTFAEFIAGMFTMLCSFDFRKFPFDNQSCDMHIFSMLDSTVIQFGETQITLMPMAIDDSIDWKLVNSTTRAEIKYEGNSEVFLTFTFNRKPYYYVTTLIIPAFALHCLILVSYFLPPDTTDRTVYAATVELAFYFFQIEFNRALPQSSTPIYMQVYLIGMLIGCTLITIYSAILCYIANVNSKLATKPVTFWGKQHQLIYVVDFFISICLIIISISLAFIPLLMCFI